jgi:hypothetical protein
MAADWVSQLPEIDRTAARFCLDGKILRWASAMEDRPRDKLSTAGHRKLAALAAKEGMTPDGLLSRLISSWRSARR